MAKKLMRILGGYITHLSLCPAGANNIQTVYKSDDGHDKNVTLSMISKDMTEQGEIFSVVYVPEMIDKQEDLASAEVIKALAYSFAQSGEGIDVIHNEKVLPKEAVYIAESFIIQAGDPRFAGVTTYEGKSLDPTGGWGVVLKVESEEIRKLYRSGQWQGISMGGVVQKRPEAAASAATKSTSTNDGDDEMTPEQLQALMEGINKANGALATSIVEGVTKAFKPDSDDSTDKRTPEEIAKAVKQETFLKAYPAPQLPANATEEHFAHMEKCIRVHELAKAVDASDVREVFDFQKMAKAIMDGKEDATTLVSATHKADPWGFHMCKSNQTDTGTQTDAVGPTIISLTAKDDSDLTDAEVEKMLEGIPGYGQVVPPVGQQKKQA